MAHLLVEQFRFAKQEWLRGHENIPADDALKRLGHANSIGWAVGHLAEFDQLVWVERVLGEPVTKATKKFGFRRAASTPDLAETMEAWHAIQEKADGVLDTLTDAGLAESPMMWGKPSGEPVAMWLLRMTWHYWYHLGEMQAIRQMLGHENLPQYVGTIPQAAQWSNDFSFAQTGAVHPLIEQTQFTKQKWLKGHDELSAADGVKQQRNANSISWMVGHLAGFDQAVWLERPLGIVLNEAVRECGYGRPASTPDLDEMMTAWHAIQKHTNTVQNQLTAADMLIHPGESDNQSPENLGTLILRQMWHYWYHLGEMQGIRQSLGHEGLAQYVGGIPKNIRWDVPADRK